MEVVAANPSSGTVPPFRNHDVREWSRIDGLTGCLERARLETDHWTATTHNSSHNYKKVVDSRARARPDGNVRQEAKRQLEVFSSSVPGGRLQVIKSRTVSSSRWTSSEHQEATTNRDEGLGFENLQLSINPLDLTPEKSKTHLTRNTRRPPSRSFLQSTAASNLHKVSRICHEFHNAALHHFNTSTNHPIEERQNGDGIEIVELEDESTKTNSSSSTTSNTINNNNRTPSEENLSVSSGDHLKPIKSIEDLEDLEQLQNWRRTSKIRRSLQFPTKNSAKSYQSKPDDLPRNTGSVRRIKEDLEKGRRLNTALRGNSLDLDALDQILQTISVEGEKEEGKEKEREKEEGFVTVESIKEMKGKLKKTQSFPKRDEEDDGIVTECSPTQNVRSYIYGMEKNGTGSLESRKHNFSLQKNEDWYNRRKSYGFERVAQRDDPMISNKAKSKVESSTDSGICRSSEIVNNNNNNWNKSSRVNIPDWNKNEGTTITIPVVPKDSPVALRRKFFERELGDGTSYSVESSWRKFDPNEEIKRHSIAVDETKYVNRDNERDNQSKFRRTSLAINAEEDDSNSRRKKVEFCKTEVHFAADSGKVNIVETDEKPPPTNNFRRRRRYSGLIPTEEFNTSGLPVFQFGDRFPNVEDLEESNFQPLGIVTVNNSTITNEFLNEFDQEKDLFETETAPKGILKNKPVRPKPYILGEPFEDVSNRMVTPWGVKLRPIEPNPPIWKSTVTVRNTFFDQEKSEKLNSIKISTPRVVDNTYCSVQDRIKQVEESKINEGKGYSTKINFGTGGVISTVIENEENGGANGRNGDCVKDPQTTTTKITIDLHDPLKSTSLILSTLKADRDRVVPRQLEELKRLYEDVYSDSETDREVQEITRRGMEEEQEDRASVVSGSWTKATAYRNLSQFARQRNHHREEEEDGGDDDDGGGNKRLHAQMEKDVDGMPNIIKVTPRKPYQPKETKHHKPQKTQSEFTRISNPAQVPSKSKSMDQRVLRQPKKSEMAYFGVPVSPQITRKAERKDLRVEKLHKKPQPIYENIEEIKSSTKNKYSLKREIDSKILDELTKAADQILQAVNGYTDEDHKYTTDEEKAKKKPLETISETKSFKNQFSTKQTSSTVSTTKQKLKHTSSNSSIESANKKSLSSIERKKKSNLENTSSSKAMQKARRLQRASSREALLQSHGSSSEDLTIEVPLRKPRLARKNKTVVNSTVTSGSSVDVGVVKKKERNKDNERLAQVALPEIRHKTAVSTIRSTAEKAKDNKIRSSDLKKKVQKSKDGKMVPTVSKADKLSTKEGVQYQPHKEKISTAYVSRSRRRSDLYRKKQTAVESQCLPCLCS